MASEIKKKIPLKYQKHFYPLQLDVTQQVSIDTALQTVQHHLERRESSVVQIMNDRALVAIVNTTVLY